MARVKVEIDGRVVSVDGDDVRAWAGGPDAPVHDLAPAYVRANPRPEPDAQGGVNVPARQRMALLRRLARGPATRVELLAAMRGAAGYVGGDDWRNRLEELRGRGRRGGGHTPLPIDHDEPSDTYRLTETFALLTETDRQALARVRAHLADLDPDDDPLLARGRQVLGSLLPDVPEARPRVERQTSSSSASQRRSPRSADRNRR